MEFPFLIFSCWWTFVCFVLRSADIQAERTYSDVKFPRIIQVWLHLQSWIHDIWDPHARIGIFLQVVGVCYSEDGEHTLRKPTEFEQWGAKVRIFPPAQQRVANFHLLSNRRECVKFFSPPSKCVRSDTLDRFLGYNWVVTVCFCVELDASMYWFRGWFWSDEGADMAQMQVVVDWSST
jgi:hypothetical protein